MTSIITDSTAALIERALGVSGGHLAIGRGGFQLHYDKFDAVWRLAVSGPMIAVGRNADPPPWHALSYAPLHAVAAAYHEAGAEIANLSQPSP
jgi:hypothetical protein